MKRNVLIVMIVGLLGLTFSSCKKERIKCDMTSDEAANRVGYRKDSTTLKQWSESFGGDREYTYYLTTPTDTAKIIDTQDYGKFDRNDKIIFSVKRKEAYIKVLVWGNYNEFEGHHHISFYCRKGKTVDLDPIKLQRRALKYWKFVFNY